MFLRLFGCLFSWHARSAYQPVRPSARQRDVAFPALSNHRQFAYIYPESSRVKSKMGWSLLVVLALATLVRSQETCLSVEDDPYLLFGTKTAYIFTNKGIANNRVHEVLGCQPIAFWLLNRHGSHYPEVNEITDLQNLVDLRNNIINNYRNGNFRNSNQRICTSDLNLLEQWTPNFNLNMTFAGDLTTDGYISTQQLAQAWKKRYPGILTDNRHDYLFKYVNDKRSSTTFRAFTQGLFGAQAEEYDIPKENDEKTLKPYKFCPAWTKDVEENNDTLSQLHIFESKQEYKEMISNISLRLGFNYDMQKDIIMRIYQMCRYNKAWNVSHVSPWCAAFSHEDLKHLEYAEDLETYYKYGYGSAANQKIGCSPIKDLMNFFTNHVNNDIPQQPRAMIQFTEAPLILMALAAMGAHRDTAPLTGDNYHTNTVLARRWTSSTMAPFNANLAAILYKCNPNGNFQIKDQYQVLFLENEQEMYLEGCRVGLCDWSYVKDKFGQIADKCDLKFCNGAAKLNGFVNLSLALIAFLIKYIQL